MIRNRPRSAVLGVLLLAASLASPPGMAAGFEPGDMNTMMRTMLSMMRLWNSFADADEWSFNSHWDPDGWSSMRDPWRGQRGPMPGPWGQAPGPMGSPGFPVHPWRSPGYRSREGWPGGGGSAATGLDGRWVGSAGDLLEIRGNRIRITRPGQERMEGMLERRGDQLVVYSRGGAASTFQFERRGQFLALRDPSGRINLFRQWAPGGQGPYRPPAAR